MLELADTEQKKDNKPKEQQKPENKNSKQFKDKPRQYGRGQQSNRPEESVAGFIGRNVKVCTRSNKIFVGKLETVTKFDIIGYNNDY